MNVKLSEGRGEVAFFEDYSLEPSRIILEEIYTLSRKSLHSV